MVGHQDRTLRRPCPDGAGADGDREQPDGRHGRHGTDEPFDEGGSPTRPRVPSTDRHGRASPARPGAQTYRGRVGGRRLLRTEPVPVPGQPQSLRRDRLHGHPHELDRARPKCEVRVGGRGQHRTQRRRHVVPQALHRQRTQRAHVLRREPCRVAGRGRRRPAQARVEQRPHPGVHQDAASGDRPVHASDRVQRRQRAADGHHDHRRLTGRQRSAPLQHAVQPAVHGQCRRRVLPPVGVLAHGHAGQVRVVRQRRQLLAADRRRQRSQHDLLTGRHVAAGVTAAAPSGASARHSATPGIVGGRVATGRRRVRTAAGAGGCMAGHPARGPRRPAVPVHSPR